MFIDLFVGHIHLRSFGIDEREPHLLWAWALALQEDSPDPRQNQLPDGMTPGSSLFFQLPI